MKSLVDIKARKKLSTGLLDFFKGEVTNYEFEDGYILKTSDVAIGEIAYVIWLLYSDHKEHKVSFSDFSYSEIKLLYRCYVFLNSELDYPWDNYVSDNSFFKRIFCKLMSNHPLQENVFWPFTNKETFLSLKDEIKHNEHIGGKK